MIGTFSIVFGVFLCTSIILYRLLLGSSVISLFYRDKTGDRHIHKDRQARIGGVVIIPLFIIAIILGAVLDIYQLDMSKWALIICSILIFIYGFLDERLDLSWKVQIVFQILIGVIIILSGTGISEIMSPFSGLISLEYLKVGPFTFPQDLLTLIWIVGLMNVINWLDGIDGLAGGIGVIGFGILFLLSLNPIVLQYDIAYFSIVLAALYLGFLRFNFFPSKIFLGTYGSMFLGFILALLSIFSGGKIATAVLVLGFPIIDALVVIVQRLASGVSIFNADKRHLHHRLLLIGLSQRQSVLILYTFSAMFGLAALFLQTYGKFIAFLLICTCMTLLSLIITYLLRAKNKVQSEVG